MTTLQDHVCAEIARAVGEGWEPWRVTCQSVSPGIIRVDCYTDSDPMSLDGIRSVTSSVSLDAEWDTTIHHIRQRILKGR